VYGSKANVPDYMVTSGGTYRILSDHLGSPRAVADVASGNLIETISFDEFGNEADTLVVACGATVIYTSVDLLNDLSECKKKVEEAEKKIDRCPPDDPQSDALSRFDVLRDCVFDALKADTVSGVLDAACVLSLIACGLGPA
jgi:hypothetical protein